RMRADGGRRMRADGSRRMRADGRGWTAAGTTAPEMSERISSFKELRVYQMAFELQQEIFLVSPRFPLDERYSLTDQVRRSSRSIGANIAEAWQKRRYIAHFVSKLTDAAGEQSETR